MMFRNRLDREAAIRTVQIFVTVICYLLFTGITIWYATWSVESSEHKWCTVIELLNNAPAPKSSPGNPSRQYDAKLAEDFKSLQHTLGC